MSKICVVGSINMDLVVTSDKRPSSGETVMGTAFLTNPGGKGANQAVAAARLDADVTMLGCVGNDIYGQSLIQKLIAENVDVQYIKCSAVASSGTAHIVLADKDNSIIVVSGANNEVDRSYIDEVAHVIMNSDMVLAQLEIPLDTVIYLADICKQHAIPLLLNPAPAVPLPGILIDNAAFITPNENEVRIIFPGENNLEELLRKYPNKLIVTLGKNGVIFFDGEKTVNVPSIDVGVVDTTGAGDTFNGGLACGVCNGLVITRAVAFANAAAGLSTIKFGAQGGMPTLSEVLEVIHFF
jgi:ribokinase